MPSPKVFISYSWASQSHRAMVLEWAERLIGDGVDVVFDQFDLKEGQDKYAFMERMITDDSVTHVLVICDKSYSEKADKRKSGVGTESQIISKEVYDKVDQLKFIPIVCEFLEGGEPFLPTFMKSRIWIDFSSAEAVNENWERLVRLLYGKPANQKPLLGNPPVYVREGSEAPASPVLGKFLTLRQAILGGKPGIGLYRDDFLASCIQYSDSLRVRSRPEVESIGQKIIEDFGKLRQIRNHIVDWVVLESSSTSQNLGFADCLVDFMEKLLEQKSRPSEVNQWNESWFEAHSLFVYECFLYIVAALIKARLFGELNRILTTRYLVPQTMRTGVEHFENFQVFSAMSESLNSVMATEGRRFFSPAAELVKRSADRKDIGFDEIMEADALIFFMALITKDVFWYPQILLYSDRYKGFPIFLRATQRRGFHNIATIAGISDADTIRSMVLEGQKRLGTDNWHDFRFNRNFYALMNLEKLDTIS